MTFAETMAAKPREIEIFMAGENNASQLSQFVKKDRDL
jgi:hypothetical protein